ncbi:MAG: PhaM family polyhydroxyalkanoate granule multifunctional regulatory protein [Betaproteobacteria bacterium]
MNALQGHCIGGKVMGESTGFGDFGKWVPGFEFLQSLTRAGASQGPAGWVAPTLSVEELDKRVQELKAVLFWLEQNSTALKATIQALEVQKMTLNTLKGMNVSLQDMAQAFSAKAPDAPDARGSATLKPQPAARAAKPAEPRKPRARVSASAQTGVGAAPGAVDPMQWWSALSQQFQQIASAAVADAQTRTEPAAAGKKRRPASKPRTKTGKPSV